MTWFETLTGCRNESPESVRQHLDVEGNQLRSRLNNGTWCCGTLETPTLAELRDRVDSSRYAAVPAVREVVADVRALHCDPANAGAMFQVASQFNLLEMISPHRTPEDGIGLYENDPTQGPACAIAAGAGTIYRNYFAEVNGQIGQSAGNQIDCLADLGQLLGNADQRLWKMVNGYALPSKDGLERINCRLNELDELQRDEWRRSLRIGLQRDTQVTLASSSHLVSQAYCSALPVSYSGHSVNLWAPFARLILEAACEATICAAIENADRTGNRSLFLTLLGGGAFGNKTDWITAAIEQAVRRHMDCGLEIVIVSYGRSKPAVQDVVQTLTREIRGRTTP